MSIEVGEIVQGIRVEANTSQADAALDKTAQKLTGIEQATRKLGESGPAAQNYANQLQSIGKGMQQVEVAGRGMVSSAQLAAERFEMLTRAVNGDQAAISELAATQTTAAAAMDAMGRSRRYQAEAMAQQVQVQVQAAAAAREEMLATQQAAVAAEVAARQKRAAAAETGNVAKQNAFAAETYTLLTQAINGNAEATAMLFATETQSLKGIEMMGRARRYQAEAMAQQLGLQVSVTSAVKQEAAAHESAAMATNMHGRALATTNEQLTVTDVYIKFLNTALLDERGSAQAAATAELIRASALDKATEAQKRHLLVMEASLAADGKMPASRNRNFEVYNPGNYAATFLNKQTRVEVDGLSTSVGQLEMRLRGVVQTADAMRDAMIEGTSVSSQQMNYLHRQVALAKTQMKELEAAGVPVGRGMKTAFNEAMTSAAGASSEFKRAKVAIAEMNAEVNLATGRARGFRGVLLGFGMAWAAEIMLAFIVIEQLVRGLMKLTEWAEDPKSTGKQWLDEWKKTLREWKDAVAEALTDPFQKFAYGNVPSGKELFKTMQVGDLLGKSNEVDLMNKVAASGFRDVNSELENLVQNAATAEHAMSGSMNTVAMAVIELREGLRAAGEVGGKAGEQLREELIENFKAGMLEMVEAANHMAKDVTDAIRSAKRAGVDFIPVEAVRKQLADFEAAWFKASAIGQGDLFMEQSKSRMQQLINLASDAGLKIGFGLTQGVEKFRLVPDRLREALQQGTAYVNEFNSNVKTRVADSQKAWDLRKVGEKAREELEQELDKLVIRPPDQTPFEEGMQRIVENYKNKMAAAQEQLGTQMAALQVNQSGAAQLGITPEAAAALARQRQEIVANIVAINALISTFPLLQKAEESAFRADLDFKMGEKIEAEMERGRQAISDFAQDWRLKLTSLPVNLAGPINAQIDQIVRNYNEEVDKLKSSGMSPEDIKQALEDMRATLPEVGRAVGDPMVQGAGDAAKLLDEAFEKWIGVTQGFIDSLGAAGGTFTAFAQRGGEEFGLAAVTAIANGMSAMSPELSELFGNAVLSAFGAGQTAPDATDKTKYPQGADDPAYKRDVAANAQRAQAVTQAITSAFGMVIQSLETIKNAQAGQQVDVGMSILGGALSGAAAGAAFTYIGAIIGAIVGALLGGITAAIANAKAKAAMAWADFGIEMGKPFLRPGGFGLGDHFKNLTEKEIHDFYQQVAETITEVTTNFINLMLKFPTDLLAGLGNFPSITGLESKPPTGTAIPSDSVEYLRNFSGNMELWLTDQLPDDIAEWFKGPVEALFVGMGMTSERFGDLWNQLKGMEPDAAMQVLNDIADALITFDEVFAAFENIKATSLFDLETLNFTKTGEQRPEGQNDFMYDLSQAEEKIAKFAQGFAALPFSEQAAAAKQLALSVKDVMAGLIQYLNQIAEISKSIAEDVDSRKFGAAMSLAGDDRNKQLALINSEYDKVKEQLANAGQLGLNPDDVQRLYQRAADLAAQAYDLEPTQAAFELYSKQLDYLAELANAQLAGMASAAEQEIDKLLALMQPFVDFLKGDTTAAMDGVNTAAEEATGALIGFSVALDLLGQRLAGPDPFGEHTGGIGGGDPNNTDNPTNQPIFIGEGTPEDPYRLNPEFPGGSGGDAHTPSRFGEYFGEYPDPDGYDAGPSGGRYGKPWWWNPGEPGPISDPYQPDDYVDNKAGVRAPLPPPEVPPEVVAAMERIADDIDGALQMPDPGARPDFDLDALSLIPEFIRKADPGMQSYLIQNAMLEAAEIMRDANNPYPQIENPIEDVFRNRGGRGDLEGPDTRTDLDTVDNDRETNPLGPRVSTEGVQELLEQLKNETADGGAINERLLQQILNQLKFGSDAQLVVNVQAPDAGARSRSVAVRARQAEVTRRVIQRGVS